MIRIRRKSRENSWANPPSQSLLRTISIHDLYIALSGIGNFNDHGNNEYVSRPSKIEKICVNLAGKGKSRFLVNVKTGIVYRPVLISTAVAIEHRNKNLSYAAPLCSRVFKTTTIDYRSDY